MKETIEFLESRIGKLCRNGNTMYYYYSKEGKYLEHHDYSWFVLFILKHDL